MGKGYALQHGFRYARKSKFDILIFEGSTFHRVLPQKNTTERLSLAFNTVKR